MAKDLFGQPMLHPDKAGITGEDYAGIFVRQTLLAILINTGEAEIWLPKAEIALSPAHHTCDPRPGEPVTITVPDWLAREKGLIPS